MAARSKQAEGAGEDKDVLIVGLGVALREFRKNGDPRLTQAELSEKAGLPPNAVGDLERGERTIKGDELKSICRVLGVPLRVFMARVVELQLEAMGEEPEAKKEPDRTAPAKGPDLYVMMALAGRTPEEVLAVLHKVMLASAPPKDE